MYFFDTPILAQRLFGPAEERQEVEALVQRGGCYATKYVQEQFESTFVRSAIVLHTALRDARNIADTLRCLDRFPITHGDGVKARKIFARLIEIHEPLGDDIAQILDTLERWIEQWLMVAAFDGIEIVDATQCCLCDSVTRNEYGVYTARRACNRKDPRPCVIEGFWAVRHALLTRKAEFRFESLPKEERTTHVSRALDAARDLTSGISPRGKICWVDLSDSVIVCESHEVSILVTTNINDFKALARIVGGERRVSNVSEASRRDT